MANFCKPGIWKAPLIFLTLVITSTQIQAQEEAILKKYTGYFDADNKKDTLTVTSSAGNGGSYSKGRLTLSTRKHPISIEATFSFWNFFQVTPIPDAVTNLDDYARCWATGYKQSDTTKDIYKWVLDIHRNAHTTNKHYVTREASFSPAWSESIPDTVITYAITDKYFANCAVDSSEVGSCSVAANRYIAIYYGHNHTQRQGNDNFFEKLPVNDIGNMELYRTAHGIYAKQNGRYAWLFVNTTSDAKLRHPSIHAVKAKGKKVLITTLGMGMDQGALYGGCIISLDDFTLYDLTPQTEQELDKVLEKF